MSGFAVGENERTLGFGNPCCPGLGLEHNGADAHSQQRSQSLINASILIVFAGAGAMVRRSEGPQCPSTASCRCAVEVVFSDGGHTDCILGRGAPHKIEGLYEFPKPVREPAGELELQDDFVPKRLNRIAQLGSQGGAKFG